MKLRWHIGLLSLSLLLSFCVPPNGHAEKNTGTLDPRLSGFLEIVIKDPRTLEKEKAEYAAHSVTFEAFILAVYMRAIEFDNTPDNSLALSELGQYLERQRPELEAGLLDAMTAFYAEKSHQTFMRGMFLETVRGLVPGARPASGDADAKEAVTSSPTVPIVELRQYTLKPGRRDTLIDLFESEFVESQETLGMKIVGMFRDLERPDRFVWIRGFKDMPSRAEELNAFYSGPVWKAHREAANATMIDTDDVLLLREAKAGSGFRSGGSRPERRAMQPLEGLVIASIYPFATAVDQDFVDFFSSRVAPELRAAGVDVLLRHRDQPQQLPAPSGPGWRACVRVVCDIPGVSGLRSIAGEPGQVRRVAGDHQEIEAALQGRGAGASAPANASLGSSPLGFNRSLLAAAVPIIPLGQGDSLLGRGEYEP